MKNSGRLLVIAFVIIFSNCSQDADSAFNIFSQTYDFSESQHGWEAEFTDYPAPVNILGDTIYEWSAEYTELPAYLGGQKAMKLSTNNVSGDVFMFMKKKITGFQPDMSYTLVFEVDLASNAVAGQGVTLKAGASAVEPKKVIENNLSYGLNLDKGEQFSSGEDMMLLGDIGALYQGNEFTTVTKSNANANSKFLVRTNSKGEIWLIVGTDSAFLGVTTVYYKKISVVFSVSS